MLENMFWSKSTVDVSIVIIFDFELTLFKFNERKLTLESLIEEGAAINKKIYLNPRFFLQIMFISDM